MMVPLRKGALMRGLFFRRDPICGGPLVGGGTGRDALFFWAFSPQGETTALPLKYPLAAFPCLRFPVFLDG